ncbi:MAG: outer membrane protein transport protein [Bacteroidota bacterium]
MKKNLSIIALVLGFLAMNAQDATDALRYSQTDMIGTARFRAMSGAFGAVGGDFSAISINPASSSVFNNNQFAGTLNVYTVDNKSDYFGTKTKENASDFTLNQAGAVFVFENNRENSDWKKFALAINYENLNNYENSLFSSGYNPTNSVANYFTQSANGVELQDLDDLSLNYYNFGFRGQQAFLAYNAYLINPTDPNDPANTTYLSNAVGTGNFYQENEVVSTGYNGKLSFNASALYQDKMYIGINLNYHASDYLRSSSVYEDYADATGADNTIGVQALRFNNQLYTYGNGFSFQLGTIIKLTNEFRIGGTYESPTWMRLNDELTQTLATDCADCPDPGYFIDPQVTNIYAPYTLKTPGKLTASAAYVFGSEGMISIDFSTKDYSKTEFRPTNEFNGVNNDMSSNLTKSNELRIGAEKKHKQWSFRAGYRMEESPYKNKSRMGDLTGYSGGLGYNFGGTRLDLAYSTAKRTYGEQFLSYGMTDAAKINNKNDNVTITLAFEL